jgi:surface-anchored protein
MKNKHLLLFLAAAAVFASTSGAMAQAIWTSGHGGHKMKYDGSDFAPVWGYAPDAVINGVSGSGGEYALGTLLPVMPYSASSARPAGAAWDFIGAGAGADLWVFPATQDPNLPWIGFSTTALTGGDWTGNITITLTSVTGSGVDAGGHMSIYETDAFGDPQAPLAQTFGGIGGTSIEMVPGTGHLHPNYAFTQPGTYNATYTITGTHAVDGAKSATATYNFEVVPEPGAVGLALLGLSALAAAKWLSRKP